MLVAITVHNGRVAPVFDVATTACLLDTAEPDRRSTLPLPAGLPERAHALETAKVTHLVCGAISRPALFFLLAEGIQVASFIAGDLDIVINAVITGDITRPEFAMPGCNQKHDCCHRKRRGHACGNTPDHSPE